MNRARTTVACALLLACLGASRPAITVDAQVQRTSFDLLDPIAVSVGVWNHGASRVALHFAQTTEYVIDVLDGATVISTTLPSPVPTGVPHQRWFFPGVTVLAIYDLSVEGPDHTVPRPGTYRLRVRLLDREGTDVQEQPLRFLPPLTIAALAKTGTHAVTIEGTLAPDRQSLTDSSGSVAFTHRLLNMPVGATVVVRGAMTETASRTKAFDPVSWGVLNASQ